MINYSVFMMTPNIGEDETPKAYARNQVSEIWPLEKFSKHIADHNGVFSRGTVKGVISDMCECLVEQLLNGNKIELGELGTFSISISSEGAESIEKFTSKNIKEVNILSRRVWTSRTWWIVPSSTKWQAASRKRLR